MKRDILHKISTPKTEIFKLTVFEDFDTIFAHTHIARPEIAIARA
jgi:hypothetical protein